MNKIDFLRKLDRELAVLDKEERKEILAFYEERFYSGTVYENKTEIEVIDELEEPEVIARNVLEEYGVSPKFIKTKEDRYTNVSIVRVIWIILFDVFVVSWLLPTLYGVVVSVFAALLSYVGVIGFLFNSPTLMDKMLFGFMTGGYILIFLFALLILDLSIWTTKKILIYHLNVFKFRHREKVLKRLHKISVDEWFKKHRLLNTIKSVSFIGAIVLMSFTGFYLFTADENVFDVYGNQEELLEVTQHDLTQDIIDGVVWEINANFDNMSVEIFIVAGDEITITHTYFEDTDYTVVIDEENHTITIENDVDYIINIFSIEELFFLLNGGDRLVIEVPENLLLGDVSVSSLNGEVEIRNISTDELDVIVSNGDIYVDGLTVTGDVSLKTTNGTIKIKNIIGNYDLYIKTTNGRIIVDNTEFLNYDLYTTNGRIIAENLNVEFQDGVNFEADTTNGDIIMNDVYADDIDISTTNGDIDFYNLDETFLPSVFEKHTTNGDINTNVR